MNGFHETLFPLDVGFGASGGPERRTDIATLSSGYEERNARWQNPRRSYDAGTGVRSFTDLQSVLSFFEERRGRLNGFRFRDPFDHSSCATGSIISPLDQVIAVGDGETQTFQLKKTYGGLFAPYARLIAKPVQGTVRLALAGIETHDFSIDTTQGVISLMMAPETGVSITAGFMFDVPVRFDTDKLEFSISGFDAGDIPSIPLVEIRL
ncbi:TIGR02217 family protein [Cohaesibacter sp. ES.047]|uniref:DUF2460 domain-containing protein n=1 Tax=Cohaesibacter sp. ES.047 TaxID=1798205 RepID=UPI000BBFECE3|nr:DUF2460 domain-containing protein [Cohaesibacter sp. ES.047]SNY92805.1 TIGR02217 family protein [Cohaesibacter sp. ES.047]